MDVLILRNNVRVYGVLLSPEGAKEVRFLMRGSWLKSNAPELLAQIQDRAQEPGENGPQDELIELLSKHVESLRAEQLKSPEQIGFLQERLDRLIAAAHPALEQLADAESVPNVVILRLPSSQVRRQLRQNENVRRLAGLAILNQIDDCEQLKQDAVRTELQKILPADLRQDLPSEVQGPLPANGQQVDVIGDLQFNRILLDADRIFGRTCRLILQSGKYIPDSESSSADLQQLAVQMLQRQVQAQLNELLSDGFGQEPAGGSAAHGNFATGKLGDPLAPSAATIADREHADVVEVTQMQVDPSAGKASVRIDVYYRTDGDNSWRMVVQAIGTATSSDISEAQKQRIANDPRVQQVTQLFGGLGSSNADVMNAVSIGACVQTAQAKASEKLNEIVKAGVPGSLGMTFTVVEAFVDELSVVEELSAEKVSPE